MAKETNAELRRDIKRLEAEIRQFRTRGRLEEKRRKVRHARAKARFSDFVGDFLRKGRTFKEAVREAKKAYDKL